MRTAALKLGGHKPGQALYISYKMCALGSAAILDPHNSEWLTPLTPRLLTVHKYKRKDYMLWSKMVALYTVVWSCVLFQGGVHVCLCVCECACVCV